jgi:hypothetical protein
MFERKCSGHEFFSLTPAERTKLSDTEKKQRTQYKTKKEEREVERKKNTLYNLVNGRLFPDWSLQDII